MTLAEQVYAQAILLTGTDENSQALLQVLCSCAVAELTAQLRQGITVEDCKAEFVAAASLYALAALSEADEVKSLEQVQIGDVTVRRGQGSVAARCLRKQAQMILFPFVEDPAVLRRV